MYKEYSREMSVSVGKYRWAKVFSSLVVVVMILLSFIAGAFLEDRERGLSPGVQKAEAFDLINWVMCKFGEDTAPGKVYRAMYKVTQTSDLQYQVFSKSSLNSGIDDVRTGMNSTFSLFDYDFTEVNESILGVSLTPEGVLDEDADEEEREFNSGPRVNAFDRFGVAGLKFSSYGGEWKYYIVDPCSNGGDPQDPQAGLYYQERLEPMSPWEDIQSSKDVRTMQFSKGFFPSFRSAFNNHVANFFFAFTKIFVVGAILLLNMAFSNIVEFLGLDTLIAGDGSGGSSIFSLLFDNVFMPMVLISVAFTGLYILYLGVVKREFRKSLGVLARTLALYVAAVIASLYPLQVISLPNNIAVVGQSIIIQAMGGSLTKNSSELCATDVGASEEIIDGADTGLNAEKSQGILEEASKNMRSVVSCQFWEVFLFRPWVEAQWGAHYNDLWAVDNVPSDKSGAADLGNENDEWVGDAAVPMGGEEFLNNWALFQLSTQTNVHSPIGSPNEVDVSSMGVGRDWWRIVDAVSNYDEETEKSSVVSHSEATGGVIEGDDISTTEPKETKVTEYWDTWVGNETASRVLVAQSSLFIAIIGLSLPLIFSLLSAVYSIGLALMMALAPVMFLVGIYQPHGWDAFLTWAQEVINLMIKRIVFGFLLVLSLIFTTAAIKAMEDVGWVQGLLLVIVFALILWKFKDQILNSFASVAFTASNFSHANKEITRKLKKGTRSTARVTTAGVVGAAAAKKKGGTLRSGLMKGASHELRQQMYQSDSMIAKSALTQMEIGKGKDAETIKEGLFDEADKDGKKGRKKVASCPSCGADMAGFSVVGRTQDGSLICENCLEEGVEGARRVYVGDMFSDDTDEEEIEIEELEKESGSERDARFAEMYRGHEDVIHPKSNLDRADGMHSSRDLRLPRDASSEEQAAVADQLVEAVASDLTDRKYSANIISVELPGIFKGFLSEEEIISAMQDAWAEGDYTFIHSLYAAAIKDWMDKNTELDVSFDQALERLENEVKAQDIYRDRHTGQNIDPATVETWNVDGEMRYADAGENLYTKDYSRKLNRRSMYTDSPQFTKEREKAKERLNSALDNINEEIAAMTINHENTQDEHAEILGELDERMALHRHRVPFDETQGLSREDYMTDDEKALEDRLKTERDSILFAESQRRRVEDKIDSIDSAYQSVVEDIPKAIEDDMSKNVHSSSNLDRIDGVMDALDQEMDTVDSFISAIESNVGKGGVF